MELGRYFSADDFNEYVSELKGFVQKMIDVGIDPTATELFDDIPFVMWYHSSQEFRSLFNTIEETLSILDGEVEDYWDNPFSKSLFTYKKKNGSLYPYVKRWYDWLNYNNEQYEKQFGNYEYLYTIENGIEEQAFDINNEPIQVIKQRS